MTLLTNSLLHFLSFTLQFVQFLCYNGTIALRQRQKYVICPDNLRKIVLYAYCSSHVCRMNQFTILAVATSFALLVSRSAMNLSRRKTISVSATPVRFVEKRSRLRRGLYASLRHELNKTMLTLYKIGEFLWYGKNGMSKDKLKALDYWIRAAELGSAEACGAIVLLCERDTVEEEGLYI